MRWGFGFAGLCLLVHSAAFAAERVVDLPVRGSTMRVLIEQPATTPVGAAILIAGGRGRLDIEPGGRIRELANNQLVRTRSQYASQGFVAVVPDIAEDLKQGQDGVKNAYRWSAEQAADLGLLVEYLRQSTAKVFLLGTSRGALSVANAAVRLQGAQKPDAIVITSGMIMHQVDSQPSVQRHVAPLGAITMPVLLMAHEADACAYTPARAVPLFKDLLTAAPRVDIVLLKGGRSDRPGMECEAGGHHGFMGLDQEVVATVSNWLKGLN